MIVKPLFEPHLEFLSLKWSFIGSSESTFVKIPNCLKSHVTAHFISQCISVPYIERGLCKLEREVNSCNFTYARPIRGSFYESNYNACRFKLFGFIGLFSLHIEPPSNYFIRNYFIVFSIEYERHTGFRPLGYYSRHISCRNIAERCENINFLSETTIILSNSFINYL